jgi:tRNA-Thr(GGU) m(6)t(6)A37 methyltransferase TsaA
MSAKSPDKRSKRTTAPRGRDSRNTDEFEPDLTDIEGFSHLIVIWEFDRSEGFSLVGKPPTDDRPHGVFATRSPRRPNPIGLTVVELLSRDGGILRIRGIDMLDGAPILDIKLSLKCTLGRATSRLARGSRSACQCKTVGGISRSRNSRATG